jgi:hypothetical protein
VKRTGLPPISPSTALTEAPLGGTWGRASTGSWKRMTRPVPLLSIRVGNAQGRSAGQKVWLVLEQPHPAVVAARRVVEARSDGEANLETAVELDAGARDRGEGQGRFEAAVQADLEHDVIEPCARRGGMLSRRTRDPATIL